MLILLAQTAKIVFLVLRLGRGFSAFFLQAAIFASDFDLPPLLPAFANMARMFSGKFNFI